MNIKFRYPLKIETYKAIYDFKEIVCKNDPAVVIGTFILLIYLANGPVRFLHDKCKPHNGDKSSMKLYFLFLYDSGNISYIHNKAKIASNKWLCPHKECRARPDRT
jgi:hypothetical protein